MNGKELQANIWKLYLIQACRWFLLLMPVLNLFYQENGLSLDDVFIVQAFYSICIIISEVPSGYFADTLGRKTSMLIGAILGSIGFIIYANAYSLEQFLFAQFFIALGTSFISGSDAALLYDTLLHLNSHEHYKKMAGKMTSVSSFSEGFAGLVGGSLALISLRTPLYCQATLMVIVIPIVLSLREPPRCQGNETKSKWHAIIHIIQYALNENKEVKWLIIYASLVGTSTLTIVWLVQPYLLTINWPLALYGPIWAALQFSIALFALRAHKIEAWLGRKLSLLSLIAISSMAYFFIGLFNNPWAGLFFFAIYFVRGVNGPVLNDYINRCVASDIRATVLSVKNLIGRIMFTIVGPLVGIVSEHYSLSTAFLFCSSIFAFFGLLSIYFLYRNQLLTDID